MNKPLAWRVIERITPYAWRERRDQRAIRRHFDPLIEAAEKARDFNEAAGLTSQYHAELLWIDQERYVRDTRRLVREAHRLRVRTPPWYNGKEETGYWDRGETSGDTYLTQDGYELLREALRKERLARWEEKRHWIALVTAASGIIGTLAGFLAGLLAGGG